MIMVDNKVDMVIMSEDELQKVCKRAGNVTIPECERMISQYYWRGVSHGIAYGMIAVCTVVILLSIR